MRESLPPPPPPLLQPAVSMVTPVSMVTSWLAPTEKEWDWRGGKWGGEDVEVKDAQERQGEVRGSQKFKDSRQRVSGPRLEEALPHVSQRDVAASLKQVESCLGSQNTYEWKRWSSKEHVKTFVDGDNYTRNLLLGIFLFQSKECLANFVYCVDGTFPKSQDLPQVSIWQKGP